MRVSVSLTPEDVALLDEYARASGLQSRSAALQHAIRLLPPTGLEQDYDSAWDEWNSSTDRGAWEGTVADGLADASR